MPDRSILLPVSVLALAIGAFAALDLARTSVAESSPPASDAPTMTTAAPVYSKSGFDITPYSKERVEELAKKLDPEQYRVTQKDGTEAPFCGNLLDNKKDGVYCCVVCGLPLFDSSHKFNSGTGWPSFFREFDPQHVMRTIDRSHGMIRTEIDCSRCGAHLGHVFDDGPKPSGERHCLNSASLVFYERGSDMPIESRPTALDTAYFAAGCFWGVEHAFAQVPGVIDAVSGYQNGRTEKPTYKEVCAGTTNHAESVKVVFDPKRVSYEDLVRFFFLIHDPTTLNRQGPDFGTQYRSGIFTASDEQLAIANRVRAEVQTSARFGGRGGTIVTVIEPATTFWAAEDYHQDYVENTGRACHVDIPGAMKAMGWSR